MNWKIAEAKQRFSEVVKAAEEEPQWIFNREKLVAGVVPAETLKEFLSWRRQREGRSLAEAFDELRRIAAEEDFELEVPSRRDRANLFPDALDDLSR